ncbi:hypothetical protein ABIA35_003197 [Catenulispora sp. MAP12-49]|uniref:hypothetical protein n=1 Tax=Catenulispora sp. MAP12-49 TaxID=3156302 RepID=UPI00351891A6
MGLFRRREPRVGEAVDRPPEPWDDDPEPDYAAGVHELTVLSEGVTLAEPLNYPRDARLVLAGATEPFGPGQLLMLGGQGWSTFEMVQVWDDGQVPRRESCPVWRQRLGSACASHPVGTPVTPVTPVTAESGRVLVLVEPEPEPEP